MFNLKKFLHHAFVASLVGCSGFASLTSQAIGDDLTIGSNAPALDIEHWVQDGNGKFKPVTEFAKGKVYIVEFWATWCGPCIASMPHIVETQKKYADKGVQIVSISDEDLETVDKFLDRKYKAAPAKKADDATADESGDEPKTYRDLTSSYCLTTDPDRSASKDYMEAAGQNGIPCAFIVGKDQKIEWIGHPMSMDKALEDIVADKWDREAFAEEFAESQKMDLLMAKISQAAGKGKTEEAMKLIDDAVAATDSQQIKAQLQSMKPRVLMAKVMSLVRSGKSEEALAELDGLIEVEKNPGTKKQMEMTRVQLLMSNPKSSKFVSAVTEALAANKDNPGFINAITWSLYEKFAAGELKDKDLLKASRAAAEQAAEVAEGDSKAAILDTAAHYQFLDGDIKTALKTQTEALKLAEGPVKADIEAFLEEIKAKAGK